LTLRGESSNIFYPSTEKMDSSHMSNVTVAATQMACSWALPDNLAKAEKLIRQAASQGAQIILIQELFETPYFCIEQNTAHLDLAHTVESSPVVQKFSELARELNVVLPCSFFEKAGCAFFNTVAIIDADGSVMGTYRKSHIPNGPGYQEKNYFNPGDSGFKVWNTRHAKIGVGICWDQWFPEAARCMVLQGAELLIYPTAIGSEPFPSPPIDSSGHWQRAMCGHAAANMVPLFASNRIGKESSQIDNRVEIGFYGHSFIADHTGRIVAQADKESESVITHSFDLDECRRYRESWGIFRDRRPDLYGRILTLDGQM
jgi:N-carbamoylputrescine amidase